MLLSNNYESSYLWKNTKIFHFLFFFYFQAFRDQSVIESLYEERKKNSRNYKDLQQCQVSNDIFFNTLHILSLYSLLLLIPPCVCITEDRVRSLPRHQIHISCKTKAFLHIVSHCFKNWQKQFHLKKNQFSEFGQFCECCEFCEINEFDDFCQAGELEEFREISEFDEFRKYWQFR